MYGPGPADGGGGGGGPLRRRDGGTPLTMACGCAMWPFIKGACWGGGGGGCDKLLRGGGRSVGGISGWMALDETDDIPG